MIHTDDYSKREIDILFGEIKDQLNRIESQTIRTNGSVRDLKQWRAYLTGGFAIFSVIIIPALGYLTYTLLAVDKQVEAHIEATK
jgi:hypothetical protein